jgi:plasmid stabilization system protein ParE
VSILNLIGGGDDAFRLIFEIEISAQADNDLRNIYEYIAYELQSPENAKGQLDRLEKSILSLEQMPERVRAYEKIDSQALATIVSCK